MIPNTSTKHTPLKFEASYVFSNTINRIDNILTDIQKSKLINSKTQIITPTVKGEKIYDVVYQSMPDMLNPKLTASWEKGLTMVAEGQITSEEYMKKLTGFVGRRTEYVKQLNNQRMLYSSFDAAAVNYRK